MQTQILTCLHNEVKPATGCTEPVAIALCAAYAARGLDHPSSIDRLELKVSTNILKNAMNVGVPRTSRVGLEIAASLGVFGDANQGMNVLKALDQSQVTEAHRLHQLIPIQVKQAGSSDRIYIDCTLHAGGQKHRAIISGKHDALTYYSVNDEVYFKDESDLVGKTNDYQDLFNQPLLDLLQAIDAMPAHALAFMMDGYHMNKAIADYGVTNGPGLGLGKSLGLGLKETLSPSDLLTYAMQLTAGASDARMSGADYPVMTSNGSGNNGLTAVLPIVAADLIYNFDNDKVVKALAMSHMINSYIKHYLGRLSSVCACGVASGTGAAVGIGYLLNIPLYQLPHLVDTMIANLSGMVCDGAKLGCALKLSTATAASIQSVYMLLENAYADQKNGIVGATPEESVKNLAFLANKGMASADNTITDILLSKLN